MSQRSKFTVPVYPELDISAVCSRFSIMLQLNTGKRGASVLSCLTRRVEGVPLTVLGDGDGIRDVVVYYTGRAFNIPSLISVVCLFVP